MENLTQNLASLWSIMADQKNLLMFALLGVGYFCRASKVIPNNFIPLIVLIVGVVFGPMVVKPLYSGILYGLTMAAIASLMYEAVLKHVEDWFVAKFLTPPTPPDVKP